MRNKVQLIGNVGALPTLKEISGQAKVASVSLATHEYYRNAQGKNVQQTTWHNLVLWNKMAERAASFLQKGAEVVIQGKLVNHSYEDKNGQKRTVSKIMVNDFKVLHAEKPTQEPVQDAKPKKGKRA